MSNTVVSVAKAAKLVKKHKQTLYNHNDAGKLSFVRRDDDSLGVEIVELQRVYGKLHVKPEDIPVAKSSTQIDKIESELGKRELELKYLKEANDRLSNSVESWKEVANKATESQKLLEHDKREREKEWRSQMLERREEIRLAKAESDKIRQREVELAEKLRLAQSRMSKMESRGFFARLMNKKVEVTS